MSNQTYNGWTNQQTWNISLMYEETFRSISEEQADQFDDAEDLAKAYESIVAELEFDHLKEGSLAYYAVGVYLCKVDWLELAEHFGEEMIAEKMEQERLNNCELITD